MIINETDKFKLKNKVQLKHIEMLNNEIFPSIHFNFLPQSKEVLDFDPIMNIFYWCVLSNRPDIAVIFWRLGKVIIKKIFILTNFLFYAYS